MEAEMIKFKKQILAGQEIYLKTDGDEDYYFESFFDPKSGAYVRGNLIVDGKNSGVDAFNASFPELIDIGIMG
jgi:hypothetical protein